VIVEKLESWATGAERDLCRTYLVAVSVIADPPIEALVAAVSAMVAPMVASEGSDVMITCRMMVKSGILGTGNVEARCLLWQGRKER
jgi:hypothetical protein